MGDPRLAAAGCDNGSSAAPTPAKDEYVPYEGPPSRAKGTDELRFSRI